MPGWKGPMPDWTRHAGIGVEYAAAVAGFGLIGYWIDLKFETGPWALIIGVALGLIGATYNLIRESKAAFKKYESERHRPPSEADRAISKKPDRPEPDDEQDA